MNYETTLYDVILPIEIRRQILIEAFGDRTIHMDLTYGHPPMPGNKEAHAMIQEWRLGLDKSRPKSWSWRGCTCHRKPPPWHPAIVTESLSTRAVDKDRCCVGLAHCCDMWTKNGKELYGCWIGALGWLQTCRQAYTEGIDVLYNVCVGKNLPREKDLNAILLILDNHFPSLKKLNLALKLGLSKDAETQFKYLFVILDEFFIRHVSDRMREPFAVSVSYAAYEMFFHWQIWRFFGGEYVLPQKPWTGDYFNSSPGQDVTMGIGFILARSIFALEGAGAKHLMEIKGSKL
ncbi:hypothetical protein BKA60DRAFT_587781, partial [Fusarium oxysporum]